MRKVEKIDPLKKTKMPEGQRNTQAQKGNKKIQRTGRTYQEIQKEAQRRNDNPEEKVKETISIEEIEDLVQQKRNELELLKEEWGKDNNILETNIDIRRKILNRYVITPLEEKTQHALYLKGIIEDLIQMENWIKRGKTPTQDMIIRFQNYKKTKKIEPIQEKELEN